MLNIKTKIVVAVMVGMALGLAVMLTALRSAYDHNVHGVLTQSLQAASEGLRDVESADVKLLSATLTGLLADPALREAFTKRDRTALYALAKPIFDKLERGFDITHWYFIEPDGKCFLRVHKPAQFGDTIGRATYKMAAASKGFGVGKELGKTGFALRVVHPYVSEQGQLLGYMEVGEEIAHFAKQLRQRTGDEVAIIAGKKHLVAADYAGVRAAQGLENNWDEHERVVVLGATMDTAELPDIDATPEDVADEGTVIGERQREGHEAVLGMVPLVDASGAKAGVVYVAHDVGGALATLSAARKLVLGVLIALALVLSTTLVLMLHVLVFRRLSRLELSATMVVGGDYDRPIDKGNSDEVGRLEALLEQFRVVFVSTLRDLEKRSRGT